MTRPLDAGPYTLLPPTRCFRDLVAVACPGSPAAGWAKAAAFGHLRRPPRPEAIGATCPAPTGNDAEHPLANLMAATALLAVLVFVLAARGPSPAQSVEASSRCVSGESPPRRSRPAAYRRSTEGRTSRPPPGGCGLWVSHSAWQAGDHTPAVLSSFSRRGGDGELVCDQPVGDEQSPVLGERSSGGAQRLNGSDMSCRASRIVTRA